MGIRLPDRTEDYFASRDRVTAGYFDAIGNPIVRGRGISEQDTAASRHVAVVNEAFARKFFKNEDPIGKHFGRDGIGSEHQYEIVGIAKDARYFDPTTSANRLLRSSSCRKHNTTLFENRIAWIDSSHFLSDIVIATRPGASLPLPQVRQAMAAVDPNLPLILIHTLRSK